MILALFFVFPRGWELPGCRSAVRDGASRSSRAVAVPARSPEALTPAAGTGGSAFLTAILSAMCTIVSCN